MWIPPHPLRRMARYVARPWPGIKPVLFAVKAWSQPLDHPEMSSHVNLYVNIDVAVGCLLPFCLKNSNMLLCDKFQLKWLECDFLYN